MLSAIYAILKLKGRYVLYKGSRAAIVHVTFNDFCKPQCN